MFHRFILAIVGLTSLSSALFLYPSFASAASVANDSLYRLAKDFNDPTTCYLVARKYYTGNEYPLDKKQAATWFKKAAQAGHAKAQWYLGRMYAKGDGVAKNTAVAINYLQQANSNGQEEAAYDLAMLFLDNGGDKPDYTKAAQWLTTSAKNDNARAAFQLGKLAVDGKLDNYDPQQAEKWLRLASDLGIDEAKAYLVKLSTKNQKATGTENSEEQQNVAESSEASENSKQNLPNNSSAETNNTDTSLKPSTNTAANKTSELSAKIQNVLNSQGPNRDEQDRNSVDSMVAKALKGEAKAQYRLGMQLLNSQAGQLLAVEWLRKASNQKHSEATYQLGLLYRDGKGVQSSNEKAITLFRQAASANASSPDTAEKAASALNAMLINRQNHLLNKKSVTPVRSPLDSLMQDAKNGRLEAQYKLADMYQRGIGVTQNEQLAKHWLQRAQNHQVNIEEEAPQPRCKRC